MVQSPRKGFVQQCEPLTHSLEAHRFLPCIARCPRKKIVIFAASKRNIMSFEVSGKLVAKYDIVQRTESFKTREFVLEKTDDVNGRAITNYIKFQCVQDRTAMPDRFNLGDEVKVSFNIRGTKWVKNGQENYITNLDAWRMEHSGGMQQQPAGNAYSNTSAPPPPPARQEYTEPDDLPF